MQKPIFVPGGRKGAAVLCELLPQESGPASTNAYPDRNDDTAYFN